LRRIKLFEEFIEYVMPIKKRNMKSIIIIPNWKVY
jgi:hypothetical protein